MALRCILGAFRTSPTIALHNEAALPPVAVRLNHIRRKYAIRILTLPEKHPIRQCCPLTFPPFHETPESSNTTGPWISWFVYLFIHHTACSPQAMASEVQTNNLEQE